MLRTIDQGRTSTKNIIANDNRDELERLIALLDNQEILSQDDDACLSFVESYCVIVVVISCNHFYTFA